MAADPLGAHFDRYRREGDLAALARVVETVAPELLRLARHLRPRGQSPEDLVQATFLAALTSQASYQVDRPLRPWLFGILLHKASGSRRTELELGEDIEVPSEGATESSAEAAEAAQLVARGLERLPPIYSEVLRDHFFAGMSPREIAARRGRPPGTVRAQLHRGLRLLRVLVPSGLAGRLLWLGPARASLLRIRRSVLEQARVDSATASVPAGAAPLSGARIAGALGVVVTVAVVLGLQDWGAETQRPLASDRPGDAVVNELEVALPATADLDRRTPRGADVPATNRTGEAATDGALVVRVLFTDRSPAVGVGLRVHAWAEPSWRDNRTDGVTDAAGEFRLDGVLAGRVGIYCDRGGDNGFGADVVAGEEALREIVLPQGVDVAGEVVDARGAPVPGAGVWLSESVSHLGGRIAATCDERGRFRLRDVSPRRFLGAQAPGFAPSDLEWLASGGLREGASARLRLVLNDSGGSLSGVVVDAGGEPLAGATVEVRSILARGVRLRQDGALLGPSTPLEAKTNARGGFEIAHLGVQEYELVVNAAGHPTHLEHVALSEDEPHAHLELRLPAGGKLRGTVSFADGEPALGAVVVARPGELGSVDRDVDESGAFVLEGLAPGSISVQAGYGHGGGQLASTTLWLKPGGELQWDAILERPREYTGRVVDARGKPLGGACVRAVAIEGERASAALPVETDELAAWLAQWPARNAERQLTQVAADAQGGFTLRGVSGSFAIEVRLSNGRAGLPVRVFELPPADGTLALVASDRLECRLSGSIRGVRGEEGVSGEVYAVHRSSGAMRRPLDGDGAFLFEALPPGTFDVLVWSRGQMPGIVAEVTLVDGEEQELGALRAAR